MKKCHIRVYKKNSHDNNQSDHFAIFNEDKNPIITKIEIEIFSVMEDGKLEKRWRTSVTTSAPNGKIEEGLKSLPSNAITQIMTPNLRENEQDPVDEIAFFKLIQAIDPLPLSAFTKISELIDYNLVSWARKNQIESLIEQGEHRYALKKALEFDRENGCNMLVALANLYKKKDDSKHLIKVLERFRRSHPGFEEANKRLHAELLLIVPSDDEHQKHSLLKKKFKAALNSNQQDLASKYFNELSGNPNPATKKIGCNTKTIIKLAEIQKKTNEEFEKTKKELEEVQKELKGLRALNKSHNVAAGQPATPPRNPDNFDGTQINKQSKKYAKSCNSSRHSHSSRLFSINANELKQESQHGELDAGWSANKENDTNGNISSGTIRRAFGSF